MQKQTAKDVTGLTATISNFERGSIVNVSSVASVCPVPYSASYNPTTNARNGITQSAGMHPSIPTQPQTLEAHLTST